jgi:hypothetical protein
MKINSLNRRLVLIGSTSAAAAAVALLMAARPAPSYVAHEWGTFTSVQGGDGVLLDWRPLESSALPKFVYDWAHAGLNRQPVGKLAPTKAVMVTLQRMETPVIYFYSPTEQSVDVSVQFPQGFITEWYPQAAQIGPSAVPVPPTVAKMDNYAHKVGISPAFTFASLLANQGVKDSRIRWANIQILPEKQNQDLARSLPLDRSGSHYFAARETDSDYLRTSSLSTTNPSPEHEKFIFYRGVGNFATPLRVTMSSENVAVLANTGPEKLEHLFVLQLRNRVGNFIYVDHLAPGEHRGVAVDSTTHNLPVEQLSRDLGQQMAESLIKAGLYRREAVAMVKTWTDSWFQEDGMRVLYVLPRAWTDQTLPLTLDPAPRDLVRVMVGRAEVITPAVLQQLTDDIRKATEGDSQARQAAVDQLRKLGRFGQPALQLAIKDARPEISQTGWDLFRAAATKPTEQAKAF